MNDAEKVKKEIGKFKNPQKAKIYQRFFKTGKGEYGEGDKFLGLTVPQMRVVAKKHKEISLKEIQKLLNIQIHEYRLVALVILTTKYQKAADETAKKEIFDFYLKNTKNINNWDLVDISAHKIVGAYLLDKTSSARLKLLFKLVKSKTLWERRIAIIATFTFIREKQFKESLKIVEILVNDDHDLIHKAVGWMLREVGKKNQVVEEKFLKKYYQTMPRTMLRYAIEKFDRAKRDFYLGR